ncbi:Eco57I restriction-modification methylase domain-containing protein [Bacillus paralicheniformis]|uniref:Eco57I restriction-modification methylase domain-containing protein n=1 Tax=Bacillus paralicheniformis TaxID=1648923 RepID=UPI0011A9E77E|nr:N-6 DNA methylase [Bacillus paralicheniformis]
MYESLYDTLKIAKDKWENEEELRISWIRALSDSLGIDLQAERDRNDSSYNEVIIEFKSKGLFKGKTTSRSFKEAIYDRLKPYIEKKAKAEGLSEGDYIGIAIDGEHICFAKIVDGEIIHDELLPFSFESVTMVATALKDSFRRAVTAKNLVEDFGLSSVNGHELMQALSDALSMNLLDKKNNKIKMLFEEWRTLFGQVADLTSSQISGIKKSIGFSVSAKLPVHLQIPASLFVIHSYNSLIIKLLAAEIVSAHGLTSKRVFAQTVATYDDEKLMHSFSQEIEKGRLFEAAGISGFVEEAIFSWYLDACKNESTKEVILSSLRNILVKMSFYRTDVLLEARTQDVLKGFYQALVPTELRKSLGEYYTPDWLVEFTLDKIEDLNWLGSRFLDPTCGSASFLLGLIKRIREEAVNEELSSRQTLQLIIENVWGFDLNPLAVQTARVNYLIAIADLLKIASGRNVEIPILMADAIYAPANDTKSNEKVVTYSIGSQVANLTVQIPKALAFDRKRLDRVFEIMSEHVEKDVEFEKVLGHLVRIKLLSLEESKSWTEPLKATYNRILDLHRENWNGIWFRIIRNFFWSANAGEFDVIVGNPPWVRWSKLPELYRQRVKPTCLQYEIFSSTPYHGGNELDISGMITYTVADKWLKTDGYLAFVITQTHFQSPSSEGFRSFRINDEEMLVPISIDDMKELKPFNDAANKTAIALFKKEVRSSIDYPVPYNVWRARNGFKRTIPPYLSLNKVYGQVQMFEMEANPVNEEKSPWAILPPRRFEEMKNITGKSSWIQGRKGITADLNGVYFVNIVAVNEEDGLVQIETRPESGKKDIGPKSRYWIEPGMLHPLIKGAGDFKKFKVQPKNDLYVLLPNEGIKKEHFKKSDELLDTEYQLTKRYLSDFRDLLLQRSTRKLYLKDKPYYGVYNVGEYTFAPFKVVWAEQSSKFVSAVVTEKDVPLVGSRPYIPDHKVFFVDFEVAEPAFYLCGLLNSKLVREFVESHSIAIQVGNIFKHMNLPFFDPDNKQHVALAKFVQEAHSSGITEELESIIQKLSDSILL